MADMSFRGHPARVVIEVDMRKGTLRVPVQEFASWEDIPEHASFGVLRLLVGRPLMETLYFGIKEAARDFNV